MRGLVGLWGIGFVWCGLTSAVWAQLPAAPAPIQAAPNQVGVAAAVQGAVQLARQEQVGHLAKSGEPVFLGDTVTTDAQSRLQILLLDQTVFTIGPNSAIVIDTFVYDPTTDAGKVSATIVKGVFRFVSGRIAHKDPDSMTVKLPTGTIGVRGTIVAGIVSGTTATVALVGPGSITVTNAARTVNVSRVGFGTTIGGIDAPPTPPTFVPPAQLQAMAQAFSSMMEARGAPPGMAGQAADHEGRTEGPTDARGQQPMGEPGQTGPMQPGGQPADGSTGQWGSFQGQPGQMPEGFSPEQAAQYGGMMGPEGFGQFGSEGAEGFAGMTGGPMMGGPMMGGFGQFGTAGTYGGDFGSFSPEGFFGFFSGGTVDNPLSTTQTTTTTNTTPPPTTTQEILAGISKLEELRQIQTGVFHFSAINPTGFTQTVPINKLGSIRVDFDVDFGARRVGGGNSKLIVNTGISPSEINAVLNIPSHFFTTGEGDAVFTDTNPTNGLTGTFTIKNSPGVIGNLLKAEATVNQTTPTVKQGTGMIDNIPRVEGLTP